MLRRTWQFFKRRLLREVLALLQENRNSLDATLMLLGKESCRSLRQADPIQSLSEVEFKIFSQWGEDGILEWLLQRLPISRPKFIEFGVGDYREANTRFLLQNRNWQGLVLDGDPSGIQTLQGDEVYWRYDLVAAPAWITRENINGLFAGHGFTGNIGLLSIDMDGNDYWVWEALEVVQPDLVVCEYNAVFGDLYPVTIPYQEDFQRTRAHFSNLYFGASIAALKQVARHKGYVLLGSNQAGCNAFFLRQELLPYLDEKIANKQARPSLARESRDQEGNLTHIRGLSRFDIIKHLPVVRLDTGATVALESLGQVYSDAWLKGMGLP